MPGLTEEDRKRILDKLERRDYTEARGSALEQRQERADTAENEALRQAIEEYKAAHGGSIEGFWPKPKRERVGIAMGKAKEFTPKQAKTTKAIREGFKWDKLRRYIIGD